MGGCVCGGIVGWEAPVGPSGPFVAAKVTPSPRTSMHLEQPVKTSDLSAFALSKSQESVLVIETPQDA
jgi:hypothetical protein